MKVLVDTSVWSLALRKKKRTEQEDGIVGLLSELVRDTSIVIIGPIRQELLSGITYEKTFDELREKLGIFKDFAITSKDHELAARYFNICRKNGIQGSHIDFLICAVAVNNDFVILTLDKDFENYKKYTEIKTMKVESV